MARSGSGPVHRSSRPWRRPSRWDDYAPNYLRGEAAAALYAPLFATLALPELAMPATEVAAATVFTTGDVVAQAAAISTALLAKHNAQLGALTIDPQDGVHPRYCELLTTVTLPQFLSGEEVPVRLLPGVDGRDRGRGGPGARAARHALPARPLTSPPRHTP